MEFYLCWYLVGFTLGSSKGNRTIRLRSTAFRKVENWSGSLWISKVNWLEKKSCGPRKSWMQYFLGLGYGATSPEIRLSSSVISEPVKTSESWFLIQISGITNSGKPIFTIRLEPFAHKFSHKAVKDSIRNWARKDPVCGKPSLWNPTDEDRKCKVELLERLAGRHRSRFRCRVSEDRF